MWRHFVTSHQVDIIFFYGSLLPLCGSVVRVNQRDITMMSHFCHLKPRLILYHSFVLRLWLNWYSQLNVLKPSRFHSITSILSAFCSSELRGLLDDGRKLSNARSPHRKWQGGPPHCSVFMSTAGVNRQRRRRGKKRSRRAAVKHTNRRTSRWRSLPHNGNRRFFPPFFPTGFAWLCRRDCDSVWLVCLARRRISREPLTSDSLGCRANVHLTAFWCETSVEAVKRTHVSLTCQRLFKIDSKPPAE